MSTSEARLAAFALAAVVGGITFGLTSGNTTDWMSNAVQGSALGIPVTLIVYLGTLFALAVRSSRD